MKRKVFKVSRTVLANSNSQTFIPIDFSDRCLAINSRTKPDDSTKWPQLSLSGKRCVQFGLLRYSSRPRLIPPTLTARGGHHSKLHVLEWCPLTVLESHICPGHRKPPLSSKGDDGFMVSGQQELLQKLQQSNHTEKIFKFIRLFAKSYK